MIRLVSPDSLRLVNSALLLAMDGQGCPGKIIYQARPQAFENAQILIGTKNYQDAD